MAYGPTGGGGGTKSYSSFVLLGKEQRGVERCDEDRFRNMRGDRNKVGEVIWLDRNDGGNLSQVLLIRDGITTSA